MNGARNPALILSLFAAAVANAALKPTVWADIPDVAPLRVGDTYYMTSTTMHFNPGIPVMASKDLVDWKVVSYCYDTIESRAEDSLADGRNDYMFGTWASAIRYNEADGCFYVSSFNNRAKHTYLFRAKSAEGPWERFVFSDRLVYDHSLWIENGKLCVKGYRGARMTNLTKDEQVYLMTLFAIARSPLFVGSDLPSIRDDAWTLGLLTNRAVLKFHREGREICVIRCDEEGTEIRAKDAEGTLYRAVFNMTEAQVEVKSVSGATDVWSGQPVGESVTIPPHGAILLSI